MVIVGKILNSTLNQYARKDSNPQPLDPKSNALSSWATGAVKKKDIERKVLNKLFFLYSTEIMIGVFSISQKTHAKNTLTLS